MTKKGEKKEVRRESSRRTIRRIVSAFRPYRGRIALVLLTILASTALSLVFPLMIPLVFDDALAHRNMGHLLLYAFIMTISAIGAGLLGVAQTYLNNGVGQDVMCDFRNRLYAHLQNMSLHFFTSMHAGEIQSRLSNDISEAQVAITNTFSSVLTSVATLIGIVIAMLYLSPLLTFISFILLPLFLYLTIRVGNTRRTATKAARESLASLTVLLQETLSVGGILLIKCFGRKKFAQAQFEKENRELTDLNIRQQMVGRWFFMFMGAFSSIAPVILYTVAGWAVIYSPGLAHITLGGLIAFITLQGRFFAPFGQLLMLQVNIQGNLALFDRIFEYLDLPVDIQDSPDMYHLSPDEIQGRVTFKNVSFTYEASKFETNKFNVLTEMGADGTSNNHPGDPRRVSHTPVKKAPMSKIRLKALLDTPKRSATLTNLSFEIKPGQLVALVGPSGAGKTTITYLISRLYDVDSGAVEIDGYNVKKIAAESLGDLIGVVTQESYLFHTSIRQNLLYVCPDATDEEMVAAAKAAAIDDSIMKLDNGYETMVGERGYRLSGGEKQRLAIARVLLKNPRILILDEATSALDTESERLIQAALNPLMKNRTTIAIAHRLSTILAADLILVVDNGEIVERGTHQELLEHAGLYARLYTQQFSKSPQEEIRV